MGGFTRHSVAGGLLVAAGWCSAASIEGTVTDADGAPLYRVPLCLKLSSSESECHRLRWTDQQGGYRFSGIKGGPDYHVEVFTDSSASGRKYESYRTYVWEPLEQRVPAIDKNERVELPPFRGKFNFSNYQRAITLTAVDFPELASLDLQGSYVALKVFIPSLREGEPPETTFLGQVTDAARLSIGASVPLAATAIGYEIYGAGVSFSGVIPLQV